MDPVPPTPTPNPVRSAPPSTPPSDYQLPTPITLPPPQQKQQKQPQPQQRERYRNLLPNQPPPNQPPPNQPPPNQQPPSQHQSSHQQPIILSDTISASPEARSPHVSSCGGREDGDVSEISAKELGERKQRISMRDEDVKTQLVQLCIDHFADYVQARRKDSFMDMIQAMFAAQTGFDVSVKGLMYRWPKQRRLYLEEREKTKSATATRNYGDFDRAVDRWIVLVDEVAAQAAAQRSQAKQEQEAEQAARWMEAGKVADEMRALYSGKGGAEPAALQKAIQEVGEERFKEASKVWDGVKALYSERRGEPVRVEPVARERTMQEVEEERLQQARPLQEGMRIIYPERRVEPVAREMTMQEGEMQRIREGSKVRDAMRTLYSERRREEPEAAEGSVDNKRKGADGRHDYPAELKKRVTDQIMDAMRQDTTQMIDAFQAIEGKKMDRLEEILLRVSGVQGARPQESLGTRLSDRVEVIERSVAGIRGVRSGPPQESVESRLVDRVEAIERSLAGMKTAIEQLVRVLEHRGF